jgi:hypothetical protein
MRRFVPSDHVDHVVPASSTSSSPPSTILLGLHYKPQDANLVLDQHENHVNSSLLARRIQKAILNYF